MAKNRLRKGVGNLARRVERWSANETWNTTTRRNNPELLVRVRRRPVVFPDKDSLQHFLDGIGGFGNPARTSIRNGHVIAPVNDPDLAERYVLSGRKDRASVNFEGVIADEAGTDRSWSLTIASAGRTGPSVQLFVSAQIVGRVKGIEDLVDRFTVERRWLRRGKPVIEPLSMREAVQHDLQRRIEVRGAVWGAIAGGVLAVAVQLLANLGG